MNSADGSGSESDGEGRGGLVSSQPEAPDSDDGWARAVSGRVDAGRGQSAGITIRVGTVPSARVDSPAVAVCVPPESAASDPTCSDLGIQARLIKDSDSFHTRAQGLDVHRIFNWPEVTSVPMRGPARLRDPAKPIRNAAVWFGGLGTSSLPTTCMHALNRGAPEAVGPETGIVRLVLCERTCGSSQDAVSCRCRPRVAVLGKLSWRGSMLVVAVSPIVH